MLTKNAAQSSVSSGGRPTVGEAASNPAVRPLLNVGKDEWHESPVTDPESQTPADPYLVRIRFSVVEPSRTQTDVQGLNQTTGSTTLPYAAPSGSSQMDRDGVP